MATHSSVLAWEIPQTEAPGRLQSMGSLRSDTTGRLTHRQNFQCIEYTLILYDIYHYMFLQTQRVYNTNSEPEGKLWTLGDYDVSMQVHLWFNKKSTTLVSDVDNEGGYVCVSTEEI